MKFTYSSFQLSSTISDSEQEDPSKEFSAYTNRLKGALKRGPPELATPKRLERPKAKFSRVLEPSQRTQPTQAYTQPNQST